jgi:hypothetical protein
MIITGNIKNNIDNTVTYGTATIPASPGAYLFAGASLSVAPSPPYLNITVSVSEKSIAFVNVPQPVAGKPVDLDANMDGIVVDLKLTAE